MRSGIIQYYRVIPSISIRMEGRCIIYLRYIATQTVWNTMKRWVLDVLIRAYEINMWNLSMAKYHQTMMMIIQYNHPTFGGYDRYIYA